MKIISGSVDSRGYHDRKLQSTGLLSSCVLTLANQKVHIFEKSSDFHEHRSFSCGKVLIFMDKVIMFMEKILIFTEFILIVTECTKNQEFFSKMSTFKSLV